MYRGTQPQLLTDHNKTADCSNGCLFLHYNNHCEESQCILCSIMLLASEARVKGCEEFVLMHAACESAITLIVTNMKNEELYHRAISREIQWNL